MNFVNLNSFWNELPASFFVLAPMEDVTDTVFRELVLSVSDPGKLHVLFTEFTSVDGLCHPKGREAVVHRLKVNDSELRLAKQMNVKLLAQIWGNNPEKFYQASRYISENYRFDGIDINMGCPVAKIVKQGSCSALIGQNSLVSEIIHATREGSGLPVSVKTRTGIKEHNTQAWISHLLQCEVSAITLHARTQRMMSEKPAEWDQVRIAAELRNQINPQVKIIGNGDIDSYAKGIDFIAEYQADGAMVGRGIFSDPYFFSEEKERDISQKLSLLEFHITRFADTWGNARNFSILKRFFKIYVNGFEGAAALRARLMEARDASAAIAAISDFRKLSH
jgi:tRNA-dihydrouridine synthase